MGPPYVLVATPEALIAELTVLFCDQGDIKPANVMISDKGQAVLMDFGSAIPARIKINNRQEALAEQDRAAEVRTRLFTFLSGRED